MGVILGIDEAGRGAWAGPLVIGAVILNDFIDGLTDSKLLTKRQREKFAKIVSETSIDYGIGWVESSEVDSLGLTKATKLGIQRAIKDIDYKNTEIIIDGNINYLKNYKNSKCVIKADLTVPAVSAAGVLAKVARDEYMHSLAIKFPQFGFDSHVGYGTKMHIKNIASYGLCSEHRLSFKPVAVFS